MKAAALTAALTTTLLTSLAAAQTQTYPDLPVGVRNGVGGLIGQTIYTGLGTAGQKLFALDLSKPAAQRQWIEMAPFPDAPRDQAASAVVNGKLYVFGGMGKSTPEAVTAVFNQVHVYDPVSNTWTLLKTFAPREIAGGVAVAQGERILLFGGVNANIYNGNLKDVAAAGTDQAQVNAINQVYFNQRPQDYFFSRDVQVYTPASNSWQSLGVVPFAGRAGAAMVLQDDRLTIIGGELKPGFRTPAGATGVIHDMDIKWRGLPNLIPPTSADVQEGLAGSFIGFSHGALLLTGGANFPGSTAQFASGKLYAHQGLTKTWHSEVYALRNNRWKVVGQLPQAQGYGRSIQYGDELILVGGELQGGTPSTKVFSLELSGNDLTIKD